jgi:hypothetical protein
MGRLAFPDIVPLPDSDPRQSIGNRRGALT